MVIDLILDRKDGKKYDVNSFVNSASEYAKIFDNYLIVNAFGMGTEKDVKKALSNYIEDNEYNLEIIKYIDSVKWL